jgi:hypothetical protein
MVDVPELVEVPPARVVRRDRLRRGPQLRCADDPHLDASGEEPPVERTARPVRVRALTVNHEPDHHTRSCLASRTSANRSPTAPGLKPNWLMWTDDLADSTSRSIGG